MLSAREFARRCGVEAETVRRWVRAKKVAPRGRTPGGHLRFAPEQVQELLEQGGASPRARDIEAHVMAARAWARQQRRGRVG